MQVRPGHVRQCLRFAAAPPALLLRLQRGSPCVYLRFGETSEEGEVMWRCCRGIKHCICKKGCQCDCTLCGKGSKGGCKDHPK